MSGFALTLTSIVFRLYSRRVSQILVRPNVMCVKVPGLWLLNTLGHNSPVFNNVCSSGKILANRYNRWIVWQISNTEKKVKYDIILLIVILLSHLWGEAVSFIDFINNYFFKWICSVRAVIFLTDCINLRKHFQTFSRKTNTIYSIPTISCRFYLPIIYIDWIYMFRCYNSSLGVIKKSHTRYRNTHKTVSCF